MMRKQPPGADFYFALCVKYKKTENGTTEEIISILGENILSKVTAIQMEVTFLVECEYGKSYPLSERPWENNDKCQCILLHLHISGFLRISPTMSLAVLY